MQKVFITGVAGFLGSHMARHFSARGYEVSGVDAVPEKRAPMDALQTYYERQLPGSDLGDLVRDVAPDFCIHCAGMASVPASFENPAADFAAGPVLTWYLLDALCRKAPKCRTLFLSSAAVYGNPRAIPVREDVELAPISPYGYHKLLSCQICREFAQLQGMQIAIARIFSAYGPGLRKQVVWDLSREALLRGGIVAQGTGQESRDFIHVDDICRGAEIVLASGDMAAGIYNFGSGTETTIGDLAKLICANAGAGCSVKFDGRVPRGTPLRWRADISKLRSLGFMPSVAIESGVREVVNWCRGELG